MSVKEQRQNDIKSLSRSRLVVRGGGGGAELKTLKKKLENCRSQQSHFVQSASVPVKLASSKAHTIAEELILRTAIEDLKEEG